MSNQPYYGSQYGNQQPVHSGYMGSPNGWEQPGFAPLPPKRPSNPLAIVGFIASILGLGFLVPVLGWLVAPILLIGSVLSIIGYVKSRHGQPLGGLALAGITVAGLTLLAGIVINAITIHNANTNWGHVDVLDSAPTGAQAEALIGEWAFEGTPWFRFNADGTGENLVDGERFNWHGDGSFSNALTYRDWHVTGDTLTVTWLTGQTFTYTRIR